LRIPFKEKKNNVNSENLFLSFRIAMICKNSNFITGYLRQNQRYFSGLKLIVKQLFKDFPSVR